VEEKLTEMVEPLLAAVVRKSTVSRSLIARWEVEYSLNSVGLQTLGKLLDPRRP
jgi:hypothetical protein